MNKQHPEANPRPESSRSHRVILLWLGVLIVAVVGFALKWSGDPADLTDKPLDARSLKIEEMEEAQLVDVVKELTAAGRDADVKWLLHKIDDHFMGADPEQRSARAQEYNRGLLMPLEKLNEQDVSEAVLAERAMERRKMGLAMGIYRQLLLDDDTVLLVAGRLEAWDEVLRREEPVFRKDDLRQRIIELIESPSPLQFDQLARAVEAEDAVILNDMVRHPFISSNKPGREWRQLEDRPRDMGQLFSRLHLYWSKTKSHNKIARIDMSYPRELLESILKERDLATGARVMAGMIDAHPPLKDSTDMSSTLRSGFASGWSTRWSRMMTEGSGFSDDLDWEAVYAKYLGGVASELKEDEQWIVAKALGSQLSMHRARTNWSTWGDTKKSAYFKALRKAAACSDAFRITVELEAFPAMLPLPWKRGDKLYEVPPALADFLLSYDDQLKERLALCTDLMRMTSSEYPMNFSESSVEIINRGTAKLINDWFSRNEPEWMQLAYSLRRNIKGEQWNGTRLALGRAMLEALPHVTDEGDKSRMRAEGLGLLLLAGGTEEAKRFLEANKQFMKGRQDMVRQLIQSGEVVMAASISADALTLRFNPADQYTEDLHRHLAAYLEQLDDPLLRYRAALAMSCAHRVQEAKVPSRLQRLMPLAEQFGTVEFPDDESRWTALAQLACEPLAVSSGTAGQVLQQWAVSHDFLTGSHPRTGSRSASSHVHELLEAAYMGKLLGDSEIEKLEQRLQQAIAKSKRSNDHRTFFKNVLESLYEQSLKHLTEGRMDVVAKCEPISRRLYEKMVQWQGDYTGSAHAWLDLCHAAGGRLDQITPWVEKVGGRVKSSHQKSLQMQQQMNSTPLMNVLSPASRGLLERWDRPEHADMRRAVIKAFLNDASFRKMCSKQGGRRLSALQARHIYKIQTISWDDLRRALEEWKKENPKLVDEVSHMSAQLSKVRKR